MAAAEESRRQFVISVMAWDRVGIVSQVSEAVASMGGDIADLRQQVLRNYLTMIIYASFPAGVDRQTVEERLQLLGGEGRDALAVQVREIGGVLPEQSRVGQEDLYVLTAQGPNRIGFVAAVSGFCAENRINILDLYTTESPEGGSYIMILLVDTSGCPSMEEVRRNMDAFAEQKGLSLVLQHYDIFRATNEIRIF